MAVDQEAGFVSGENTPAARAVDDAVVQAELIAYLTAAEVIKTNQAVAVAIARLETVAARLEATATRLEAQERRRQAYAWLMLLATLAIRVVPYIGPFFSKALHAITSFCQVLVYIFQNLTCSIGSM